MHMQKIKSRSMVRAKRRCHLLLLNALTLILTLILIRLPCVCSSCKPSPKPLPPPPPPFRSKLQEARPRSQADAMYVAVAWDEPSLLGGGGGGGERRRRGGGMAFDNIFFCEKNWGITYTPTGFWYLKNTIWVPFYVLFFFGKSHLFPDLFRRSSSSSSSFGSGPYAGSSELFFFARLRCRFQSLIQSHVLASDEQTPPIRMLLTQVAKG